jgi:hypothetical protein
MGGWRGGEGGGSSRTKKEGEEAADTNPSQRLSSYRLGRSRHSRAGPSGGTWARWRRARHKTRGRGGKAPGCHCSGRCKKRRRRLRRANTTPGAAFASARARARGTNNRRAHNNKKVTGGGEDSPFHFSIRPLIRPDVFGKLPVSFTIDVNGVYCNYMKSRNNIVCYVYCNTDMSSTIPWYTKGNTYG